MIPTTHPVCPNCGEPINADNDYTHCEECGLNGCEECIDKEDGCHECNEMVEYDRDLPGNPTDYPKD